MDKNLNPKISVLMPVYNCRPFIEESVNSILNQTFTDFEFIIIDDCSTDGTYEYLQTRTDPRINLIRKVKNTGYTISLNMGLEMANGVYIARMDGDDISLPDRFEKQLTFMDQNPDVVVCGGGYKAIGSDLIFIPSTSNDDIVLELMSISPIAHPTAFFRSDILKINNLKYNDQYEPAEDYKMWTTLEEYGKLANLKDILLYYRVHQNQTSNIRAKTQLEKAELISSQYIKWLSKGHKDSDIYNTKYINSLEDLRKYEVIEENIKSTLVEKGIQPNDRFFLNRKVKYLTFSLSRKRKNVFEAIRNLKLILECKSILGYNLTTRCILNSFAYWKDSNNTENN